MVLVLAPCVRCLLFVWSLRRVCLWLSGSCDLMLRRIWCTRGGAHTEGANARARGAGAGPWRSKTPCRIAYFSITHGGGGGWGGQGKVGKMGNAHTPQPTGRGGGDGGRPVGMRIDLWRRAHREVTASASFERAFVKDTVCVWGGGGGGGVARGHGAGLGAFGGAHWPLATAHPGPLWVRTWFGCGGGGAPRESPPLPPALPPNT